MLWLYQRTMFGPCDKPENQALKDLNWREIATLAPLVIWAFWIGLYPKPYFEVLEPAITKIVERVNPSLSNAEWVDRPTPQPEQPLPKVVANAANQERAVPSAERESMESEMPDRVNKNRTPGQSPPGF